MTKHVINLVCMREVHGSRKVRLGAFADWIGPWGGTLDEEMEELQIETPWYPMRHWIGEKAARGSQFANSNGIQRNLLLGNFRQADPGRQGRTNHPTDWETEWFEKQQAHRPRRPTRARRDTPGVIEVEAQAVYRLTYDIRCPLCDGHVSLLADRLYEKLDALATRCAPVPEAALQSMVLKPSEHVYDDGSPRLGFEAPPTGPISSITVPLSVLAARA